MGTSLVALFGQALVFPEGCPVWAQSTGEWVGGAGEAGQVGVWV